MKVYYDQLLWGELPILSSAKSRAVHVWMPRSWPIRWGGGHGWVRQSNPVYRKVPLPEDPHCTRDLNVLVPLLSIKRERFAEWLRAKARQLGTDKGALCVLVRDMQEYVIFGVMHDTRRYPVCSRPAGSRRAAFEGLPTEIDLQEERRTRKRRISTRRTVERRQQAEDPEEVKRTPKHRRTRRTRRYHERRKGP